MYNNKRIVNTNSIQIGDLKSIKFWLLVIIIIFIDLISKAWYKENDFGNTECRQTVLHFTSNKHTDSHTHTCKE